MPERNGSPDGAPARAVEAGGIDEENRSFYARLAADTGSRKPVRTIAIPARRGKGFVVEQVQIMRLGCHEGPQVADLDLFNLDNSKEQFSSSKTRIIHGCHLTTGHRLWSHPIYERPMMTIIADSLPHARSPDGTVSHDLLYGMCDERTHFRRTGIAGLPNCRDNLTEAVAAFSLSATDVHDPFNVFMRTGIDEADGLFYVAPEATQGDYMEFYAEMNLICAISACPGLSSGPDPGGLKIEIFSP